MTTFISFARRRNPDSTVDSICTRCYQTIASGDSEASLATAEEGHSCDPNCEYNWVHQEGEHAMLSGILAPNEERSHAATVGFSHTWKILQRQIFTHQRTADKTQ